MDENLINQTLDEYIVTEDIAVEEINVPTEDIEQEITIEEAVYDILVEPEEEIVVDISESMGWISGDSRYHSSLLGIDFPNQHPISAIEGLREELNEIERLQPMYSDEVNIANYYEWNNAAYNECGYFVSLAPDTSKIDICKGSDIFGVSVEAAGFIGGQDANIPRDNRYGLIATSGLVSVRCELEVEVGDYVISNAYGYATKSRSDYGYKVLALKNKNDVLYAIISLGVQADRMNALGTEVEAINSRVTANEQNIVSAINLASVAYNKSLEAAESSSVSEETVRNAIDSILNSEEKIKEFEQIVESTNVVSAQAKAIAESVSTSSITLCNQAINKANDAWAKADTVQSETYSLCAKIDKHSVGEYSQAYGLTLEQAQSILKLGMIYVPTPHEDERIHKEKYFWKSAEDESSIYYERTFTPGYLYEWREIPGSEIGIGWVTVDKNYGNLDNGLDDKKTPINTSAMAVYFNNTEIAIGNDNNNYAYWYTDSEEVYDLQGNIGIYDSYTLYHWENNHWVAVATLKGNVNNRMVSEIYQTTNEITMGVSNTRGCIAALSTSLTDVESRVQDVVKWTTGSDENGNSLSYNLATIDRSANKDGSSIALAVSDVNGNKVLNGATIVLNQEGRDSSIFVDADKINFNGGEIKFDATNINFDVDNYTIQSNKITFTADTDYSVIAANINMDGYVTFENLQNANGTTIINGANIATGTLNASQITTGTLGADVIYAGHLDASQITTGTLGAGFIDVADLSAFNATIGSFNINGSSIYHIQEVCIPQDANINKNPGVYIGADGIGLGHGAFYVTDQGVLMLNAYRGTNNTRYWTEMYGDEILCQSANGRCTQITDVGITTYSDYDTRIKKTQLNTDGIYVGDTCKIKVATPSKEYEGYSGNLEVQTSSGAKRLIFVNGIFVGTA